MRGNIFLTGNQNLHFYYPETAVLYAKRCWAATEERFRRFLFFDVAEHRKLAALEDAFAYSDTVAIGTDDNGIACYAWLAPIVPETRVATCHYTYCRKNAIDLTFSREFWRCIEDSGYYDCILTFTPYRFRCARAWAKQREIGFESMGIVPGFLKIYGQEQPEACEIMKLDFVKRRKNSGNRKR